MTTICTICARGGSQGLPGKNIRNLRGKPLIAHTIEQALACPLIDSVHVSTDSEEIAEVARGAGADVPFLRPAHLATSTAGKVPVIVHLVEELEAQGVIIDTIVDLDPTSPLRLQSDIAACIEMLGPDMDAVITGYLAEKNPYFNMVELDARDRPKLSKQSPHSTVLSRQAAPDVYAMNASIYVWKRAALGQSLWDADPGLYIMPRNRSIDIDSDIDFRLVDMLLSEREVP